MVQPSATITEELFQTDIPWQANECLLRFPCFAEFCPKTGKTIPAFAGTCFWELCLV
jgi:hypothetical protein